jgi:hypothetical protein
MLQAAWVKLQLRRLARHDRVALGDLFGALVDFGLDAGAHVQRPLG